MIRNISTEGIVLSELKYKEKSKIIRVFTKDYGKISVMARGALGSKSPLVSVTQMFSLNNYDLFKGRSFYYIDHAQIISSNFNIRNDYDKLIMSSFILELIDRTFMDNEVNEKVFLLVKKTINLIASSNEDIMPLVLAFEIKYISFLGYRPVLNDDKDIPFFSVKDGGIIEKPPLIKEKCYSVEREDIYYLNKLLYTSLDALNVVIDKKKLLYLQNIILEYIKYNLEISDFNSLNLI